MIILLCGRDQCGLNAHSVDPDSMRIESCSSVDRRSVYGSGSTYVLLFQSHIQRKINGVLIGRRLDSKRIYISSSLQLFPFSDSDSALYWSCDFRNHFPIWYHCPDFVLLWTQMPRYGQYIYTLGRGREGGKEG